MYKEISKLILYNDLGDNCILCNLADIIEDYNSKSCTNEKIVTRIYREMKRILDLATNYGFDKNIWHNYLVFLLITNENSFSITCEKVGESDGTVNHFAKNDFKIFKNLFDYDFSHIEQDLDIDCFTTISNYKAIVKKERMYNKNVSEKVQYISSCIENAKDEEEVFCIITGFYKDFGVGMFGLNKAFRVGHTNEKLEFYPITNMDEVTLDDLVGYKFQKEELVENTEAFVEGRTANNVLLYGDSGTGKSASIKAILNQYYNRGLRMIEIYKHQFQDLSAIIAHIKNRNYKYIIYMDDLSFEEFEIEYKFLKAVIEGGVEVKPDNVLIYATSNRRHLIRETWNDRKDIEERGDIHTNDTMQEKLSLANRFGVTIGYYNPSREEYHEIVKKLAKKHENITLSEKELCEQANRWEMRHGGYSGRTAQQFINWLAGKI